MLNVYVYLKYNTLNKHFPESIFLSDISTNKTGQNFYMLPQQGMPWCGVEHRQLLKKRNARKMATIRLKQSLVSFSYYQIMYASDIENCIKRPGWNLCENPVWADC